MSAISVIKEIKTKIDSLSFIHLLLATALALLALVYFFSWSSWLFNPPKISTRLDLHKLPPRSQQDAVARIIASGNLGDCAAAKGIIIDGADYEKICSNSVAAELALARLDVSYCGIISGDSESAVRQCVERVILAKMRKENSLSVCAEAPDEAMRKTCQSFYVQEQASAKSDIEKCGLAADEKSRLVCRDRYLLDLLAKDSAAVNCQDLSARYQSDCKAFQRIMKAGSKNISACNEISLDDLAMTCRRMAGATAK